MNSRERAHYKASCLSEGADELLDKGAADGLLSIAERVFTSHLLTQCLVGANLITQYIGERDKRQHQSRPLLKGSSGI